MNPRTATVIGLVSLVTVLALSACTAPVPTSDETYVSASDAPTDPGEAVTPNPIEPDTTLIVRATATTDNGAQLSLEMQVHKSTPWDDVANQTLPAAMTEDCPGSLDGSVYEENLWSFTRANITAIPTPASTAEWSTEHRIDVRPSGSFVNVVGRGILLDDDDAAADVPLCQRDKFFTGPGKGGLAIGIPGDTLEVGAAGGFTRWANHTFGFTAPTGVTLTDCTFEGTTLGGQLNGGAAWWESVVDDSACVIGAANEAKE